MILVTLGTQDKAFTRLLKCIDKEIMNGNIQDEVIVQAGYTLSHYKSLNMKMFDLIDRDSFAKLVRDCDFLITHGGVGSILNGLKAQKKVIVCPRLSKYKEHINDHQVQITENFSQEGYIIPYYESDSLQEILNKIQDFKPKKYISNTEHIVKIIEDFIDKN